MSTRPPAPLDVRELFRPDRNALLELLRQLSPAEWRLPTVCSGWDVRDVALHILGGDIGKLSRGRDRAEVATWSDGESPGEFLARINNDWVSASRRTSPQLLIELLEFVGEALFAYFDSLDVTKVGERVSWAGPDRAPVWLDLAREYMERWVHQQHIRDAAGRHGHAESQFIAPVIAASMYALPVAMRKGGVAQGDLVVVVPGAEGGAWTVTSSAGTWQLREGAVMHPATTIEVPADLWWRVVTLGITPEEARRRARVSGEVEPARAAFAAVAIIA